MPSCDSICRKFTAAVLAEKPIIDVPNNEDVLVTLLEDSTLIQLFKELDLNRSDDITKGRQFFKKICESIIKRKFNVVVTLEQDVSDYLMWYCSGVLIVTDYLLETPRLSTEPQLSAQHFSLLSTMFLQAENAFSKKVSQIQGEPLVVAADDLVPLLIVVQNRLLAINEVRFAQINLDAHRLSNNIPKFSSALDTNDVALTDVDGIGQLHSLVTAVVCARDYVVNKKGLSQPVEPDDFSVDSDDNNDDDNSQNDIDYQQYLGLQGFLLQICDKEKPGKFDKLFLDVCRRIFSAPQLEKSAKAQQILAIANNEKSFDSDKVSQIFWCVEEYATGLQSAKAFFKSKFGTQTEKYAAFNILKYADHSTNSKMYKLIEQMETFARQIETAAEKQVVDKAAEPANVGKPDAVGQRTAIAEQHAAVIAQQNASNEQNPTIESGSSSTSTTKK